MERKLRFGDLVRSSGRPKSKTLWTDPNKDTTFSQAIRQNRVMTVMQAPITKQKDFGRIGFHSQPYASYLVFPRPLPKEPDSRIIGINYQLLEEPEVTGPVFNGAKSKPKKSPVNREPMQKTFKVTIQRTATIKRSIEVTAPDRKSAEQEALNTLRSHPFDVREASIQDKIC